MERLEELGSMPLPPYIERESTLEDKDMYQTVYCKEEGSVAAPTAGLLSLIHIFHENTSKARLPPAVTAETDIRRYAAVISIVRNRT